MVHLDQVFDTIVGFLRRVQMFYGTDEPVWLVDGTTPEPVKYHYLGSAHKEPRRPTTTRESFYPYDDYYYDSDPYYSPAARRGGRYSPQRSRSVRQPSYYNATTPPTYSSINPPPAPVVVPNETPISHTPVLPVVDSVPVNTPYVSLCSLHSSLRFLRTKKISSL